METTTFEQKKNKKKLLQNIQSPATSLVRLLRRDRAFTSEISYVRKRPLVSWYSELEEPRKSPLGVPEAGVKLARVTVKPAGREKKGEREERGGERGGEEQKLPAKKRKKMWERVTTDQGRGATHTIGRHTDWSGTCGARNAGSSGCCRNSGCGCNSGSCGSRGCSCCACSCPCGDIVDVQTVASSSVHVIAVSFEIQYRLLLSA